MGKRGEKGRRKEVRTRGSGGRPSLSPAFIAGEALPDREIILEKIDAGFIGTEELDALEQYFGDIVMQVLGR
ncbi:hypothetical protein [Bosea sp. AS-1]|uniref:hypothetical protein n=1 Tax=Bosea sp. AS-1 TaxID=2015316 RepID=UPI000B793830|nr:hypothetical protein [Bosea sp. AS-1]